MEVSPLGLLFFYNLPIPTTAVSPTHLKLQEESRKNPSFPPSKSTHHHLALFSLSARSDHFSLLLALAGHV